MPNENAGFIKHIPGDCPVAPDTKVIARLEGGHTLAPMLASEIDWDCPGDQVTDYQVIGPTLN